jgi:ABC-type multidrug transport system ATPase subunit
MSEPILMALVQLFAIVAASVRKQVSETSRTILESYLRQHLSSQELQEYLKLFDELVFFHQPPEEEPETGESGVAEKIHAISQKISRQLTARDRLFVFLKFVEFFDQLKRDSDDISPALNSHAGDYLLVLKTDFNMADQEYTDARDFISDPFSNRISGNHLLVIDSKESSPEGTRHIFRNHLDGSILTLYIPAIRTFVCRYLGNDELYLNGHNIPPFQAFILNHGSILNNLKITPVYYADVASMFLRSREKIRIEYTANQVEYRFRNSTNGIHPFSLTAESGELIGVMGGSGVGKSTLLNVMNGNLPLLNGNILINGHDLATEKEKLQGIIGFVPQDDLLIDELTVFQNLWFNARLCFKDFPASRILRTVMKVLKDIDLVGIKDLTVGDPLNKFISGGQRKRLNIALELIREPAVLFADEPTSGLSSMDSEMVMLLLKEQTLNGRLVIVNIHQPSSDIYKLFDKLLIMDKGGYPIYYGNPIDALAYFKTASSHVNPNDRECSSCGYVNPEQLLQITEAKIINEYGKVTLNRKTSPKEWYELFLRNIQPALPVRKEKQDLPHNSFKVPGRFKQFRIFAFRNLLTKVTNRQYMLINLLEAPFLAALLAWLTRYFPGESYVFGDNRNLVPYLFMSVVVSLFLGMMVSAEEIIRDRRILKRESFLDLSRFSYLNSKILLLFVLSGIQTILYVVAGNLILGIHGMTLSYWLILFSTSCFANMVGLNISAGLNSVVAIYILIPFILVPQLLLSGTIVPFDYLNPSIASREHVPLTGNLMTSRWTFEALAVEQFSKNEYEKHFYPSDKAISHYSYITAFAIPALNSAADECRRNLVTGTNPAKTENLLAVLRHEISNLSREARFPGFGATGSLTPALFTDSIATATKDYLDSLSLFFSKRLTAVSARRDAIYEKLVRQMGSEEVYRFRQQYHNENIADLVLNKAGENKILTGKGKLIRKKDPVFMDPVSTSGNAHFYAPVKILGSWRIDTFWFNCGIIWLMTIGLYFLLLIDGIRKTIEFFERIKFRKAG